MTIPLKLMKKLANRSDHKKSLHASILISGGRILSQGYNLNSKHSEVRAISPLWPGYAIGSVMINLMVKRKSGELGNSKPCPKCRELLKKEGIRKVIYFNGEMFVEERI